MTGRGLAGAVIVVGAMVLAANSCGDRFPEETVGTLHPLEGSHAALLCENCHRPDLGVGPLPTNCEGCHPRPQPHFDGACASCHDQATWGVADFDHSFFPLTDGHAVTCRLCHEGETYADVETTCMGCHEEDRPESHFEGADCAMCHTYTTWLDTDVDHSFFPIEDSHDLPCGFCHTTDDYSDADSSCMTCHEEDRPEEHFVGQDCDGACHQPTSWLETNFHAIWPLVDSHQIDCDACHGNDPPSKADPACSSCHAEDAAPAHYPGMPCELCHQPSEWTDTIHPYFPLPHGESVETCSDCHGGWPFDLSTFACVTCHPAGLMNPAHAKVEDYVFDDASCLACHPDGV